MSKLSPAELALNIRERSKMHPIGGMRLTAEQLSQIADALEENVRLRANRSLEVLNLEAQIETLTGRLEKADMLLGRARYLLAQYDDTDSRTIKRIDDYFGRKDG